MFDAEGTPRAHCRHYCDWLHEQPPERLAQKRTEADALFHRLGITFAVYGENAGTERLIPFDVVPRILPAHEWAQLEAGIKQRVRALNAFVADIYHDQKILKAGVVPAEQILTNAQYRPEMQGIDVPTAFTPTSAALTWSETMMGVSACWRTTCVSPPAFPTCSKTARC
jgi:uncharacterized circularly permuted ATP-grasp superfamily protein